MNEHEDLQLAQQHIPPAPLAGIPDIGPLTLTSTVNGPQLGGYAITTELFQLLMLLQQSTGRQDLVDALKRILVQFLAERAQRELEKQLTKAVEKVSSPGFWAKLFGRG